MFLHKNLIFSRRKKIHQNKEKKLPEIGRNFAPQFFLIVLQMIQIGSLFPLLVPGVFTIRTFPFVSPGKKYPPKTCHPFPK